MLFKKTDYHAEIWEIEAKYITTVDWNKFTKNIVDNSIKSKNLVDKSAISGFTKNADLDKKKVATSATNAELKAKQGKIIKLQAFHSSYFRGKNHFKDDRSQNYLVFQPIYRYFRKDTEHNTENILSWESK